MQTVAVDFDGVIHAYSKGWQDGSIYDPPVEGAFDALRELMSTYAVFIFTTRDTSQVASWINERTGIMCHVDVDPGSTFWNHRDRLLVTNRKLAAVAYIDDRAIRFTSWPQARAALEGDRDQELDGLYARLRDAEDARKAAVAVIQRQNEELAALKAALHAALEA